MLDVSNISVVYGKHQALNGVSLSVKAGELVVILGANGAGKSSLLRSLVGLCAGEMSGQVSLDGKTISGLGPDEIVQLGIALVPEGRAIFGDLSVEENLKLGAYADRARDKEQENLALVFELFPKLNERRKQVARTMSGGEQQMVAVGRALMSAPSILMLDEPSLGLSPLLSKELFQALARIRETGIGVLVVEQNAKLSLSVADRGYLIEVGQLVGEDTAEKLSRDPAVQAAYLGSSNQKAPALKTNASMNGAAKTSKQSSQSKSYIQPSGLDGQQAAVPFASKGALEELLKRAGDTAAQRSQIQVPVFNGPQPIRSTSLNDSKPRVVNLLQAEEAKEDCPIAALLQEFEAAASNARLPKAVTHSRLNQRHREIEYENEPLPTIPVFRKSDIQVFKRDMHGVLTKTDAKTSRGS